MASLRTLEKGLFLAALALVACNKEETDTSDTGDDTGDTDTAPVYLDPFWFGIDSYFAYNSGTNQVVAYSGTSSTGAFTQSPAIVVSLFEEGPSAQETGEQICTIIAEQAGPIAAKTSFTAVDNSSHAVLIGFEIDWAQATVTHDCDGLLDPDVWGEDLSNIETVRWGTGITAPIDTYLSQSIQAQVEADTSADWAGDWAPYLIGARPFWSTVGTIWNSGGNSTSNPKEFYYGFGNAVDGSFALVVDGEGNPTPLLVSDITDGTVPTGAYGTQSAYFLNFGDPLAEGILIAAPE